MVAAKVCCKSQACSLSETYIFYKQVSLKESSWVETWMKIHVAVHCVPRFTGGLYLFWQAECVTLVCNTELSCVI